MYQYPIINPVDYHKASKKLREFFESRGYVEIPAQPRLSILAACEDPTTVSCFEYGDQTWPLKQTGQMDLEYELLANPELTSVYCQTTSYRNEKNPIPGRHDLIFPMFEFESRGDMNDLIEMEADLLEFCNIPKSKNKDKSQSDNYLQYDYEEVCRLMNRSILEAEDEEEICRKMAPVVFLTNFPEKTHPFWNMKRRNDGTARKVDVLLYGMETIGSAEREVDSQVMYDRFHAISDGEYADLLYTKFGRDRVLRELDEFLSL
ncbi:MAG: amino acid--tRNA ligase-related protein, partial [Bacteroidota bacterium]